MLGGESVTAERTSEGTMIGTLVTVFTVGLITLVLAGVALWLVGAIFSITFGVVGFLLFKVAPILLVGWLVLKFFDRPKQGADRLSSSDRRWLNRS